MVVNNSEPCKESCLHRIRSVSYTHLDVYKRQMLELVEVKDGELFLMYENDIFKEVLGVGQYAFFKGIINRNFQKIDLKKVEITENISTNILENVKLKNYIRKFNVVNQYKACLLYTSRCV